MPIFKLDLINKKFEKWDENDQKWEKIKNKETKNGNK